MGTANIVANNFYDIEFFRELVSNPASVSRVIKDPFFNWQGHCYEIGYSNIIGTIARSVDREFSVVPDARKWEPEFQKLREKKAEGWYLGSDIHVAPLGTLQIFEGQARFAQLQYLYFSSQGKLTWEEIRARNMFTERYIKAFEEFLRLSELQWPVSVDDPIIGLFLLICDISINPGEGFPLPIQFFEAFVTDVSPGMRFLFLCRTVAKDRKAFATAIRNYSRDEYISVAEALTRPLLIHHPLLVSQTIAKWSDSNPAFKDLMARFKDFSFGPENLPVSLLLSQLISFNADKIHRPEFFCWPGAWMTGQRVSEEIVTLFDRNSALFVDKEDDDSVFPRLHTDRSEEAVHRTFESFYQFNVTYDMTSQWISTPGPFKYDYGWLSSKGTFEDCKNFADRGFEGAYGVSPDEFELI